MKGKIVQVSVSRGGVPKRAIATGTITYQGVEGDSWNNRKFHGGPNQALLLICREILEELKLAGYPLYPGALGENLTTEGLVAGALRIGQIFRAGSARLELTKVRVPCRTIKIYGEDIGRAIYDARVKNGDTSSPLWGRSGLYARVLTEGVVRAGDAVELESEMA